MASPDITPYVDLTLFDKDAQQVFEDALVQLQTHLPEWTPREGNTEVLLLEALAFEVGDLIFTVNRLPGTITEVLLRLYGIDRDLGSPPEAQVRFYPSDVAGHDLPAGVRVSLTAGNGETVVLTTAESAQIAPGQASVVIRAVGDTNTDAANGIAPGTTVQLLDAIAFLERAELDSEVGGGAVEEDDDAWFARGARRFSRLVETLVLPSHFTAAALEHPTVVRAQAIDNYNAESTAPTPHLGYVTVAVYGDNALVPAAEKAALRAELDAKAQANLGVRVADPTITSVAVNATVRALPGYDAGDVRAGVIAALNDYLSPSTWEWRATVYRNELIALMDRVVGVDRVVALTVPSTDIALSGPAPLADLSTASVTVELP